MRFLRFLCPAFICLLVACGGKKGGEQVENNSFDNPRTSNTMQRTKTDTMAVLYNVDKYLTYLKEEKVDSAMEMLYEASGDTVLPISEKRKAEVLQNIKNFPVLSYKIDELRMFTEQDTEVRYTITFFEKDDNDPRQNTLQCVINPRRVGYYWFLTIAPTTYENNYRDN